MRTVTIADLLRVVWRRWPMGLAGALLGILCAYGYLAVAPPTYTATSEVALRLPVINTFTYPGAGADRIINMNVEESLAASDEVIMRLVEVTGRPAKEVRASLTVESPVGGQKLRFRYAAPVASEAVVGADAAASAYIELRQRMYEDQRVELVGGFDRDIDQVVEDLNAAQTRIDNLAVPDLAIQSPQATAALAELSSLRAELAQLREEQSRVRSIDVTPGWITRHADETPPSSHDRKALLLLAGFMGGSLLGSIGALVWETLHRRVRSVGEAIDVAGVPLLGLVRRRRLGVSPAAVDADIRYTSLALAARVGETSKPLVLTSPRTETGRHRLVAGLAVALAVSGRQVYVACLRGRADELRAAVLEDRDRLVGARFAAVVSAPDATRTSVRSVNGVERDRRTDEADDATVLLPATISVPASLERLLPYAGAAITQPQAAISVEHEEPEPDRSEASMRPRLDDTIPVGSGGIRIGLNSADAGDSMVLIDAPPAEFSALGVNAARDGMAVVVAAQDKTHTAELRRLVERLRSAGAEPVGVILTRS